METVVHTLHMPLCGCKIWLSFRDLIIRTFFLRSLEGMEKTHGSEHKPEESQVKDIFL